MVSDHLDEYIRICEVEAEFPDEEVYGITFFGESCPIQVASSEKITYISNGWKIICGVPSALFVLDASNSSALIA